VRSPFPSRERWSRPALGCDPGIHHHGRIRVSLTLDDELVRRVRQIAAEWETTLTSLVRDHLE
jgi:hypothetical protein